MIDKYEYSNTCWWCANNADSREHKFKKSDIIREFGKGSYDKGNVIKTPGNFDVDNGLSIQGPNSTYLKFSKNICKKCNNEKSQPFDYSYDIFMSYIKGNEDQVLESREVNLSLAFGDTWQTHRDNFIKYLVKNICTRFAENNIKIEQEIIDFLNGAGELKFLGFVFQIRTDWVEFYKYLKSKNEDFGYLRASTIEGKQGKSLETFYYLTGVLQYRWFQITYRYEKPNLKQPYNSNYQTTIKLIETYHISPSAIKDNLKTNTP